MMAATKLIYYGVVAAGVAVSARLLKRKPQPIEKMVAELDLAFAKRVAVIASENSLDMDEWRKLSLVHLNQQAKLLTGIAIELAKVCPQEFAKIPAEQKCSLTLMRFSAAMFVFEGWLSCTAEAQINAVECARCFLRLFDVTEMLIVRCDPVAPLCCG
jgi:hypothetical protein